MGQELRPEVLAGEQTSRSTKLVKYTASYVWDVHTSTCCNETTITNSTTRTVHQPDDVCATYHVALTRDCFMPLYGYGGLCAVMKDVVHSQCLGTK